MSGRRPPRLRALWLALCAAAAVAAVGQPCAPRLNAPTDPMLDGDIFDLVLQRVAEVLPGLPLALPGGDGEIGTADDERFANLLGDVDLVLRTGITDFVGPFPPPTAAGGVAALPVATAEPFGAGATVPFVISASDGDPALPPGNPVSTPSLEGVPVLVAAFADLDGDGFVGATLQDGDPLDASIEDAELIPVGRRVAIATAGRASGVLALAAGGPTGAELRVVLGAAAYAGTLDPAFLGGVVPDGPAMMTRLPLFPRTDPDFVIQAGPAGPGPADPQGLAAVEIQAAFTPDPADAFWGESFTVPTDGSEPTVDVALARSGAFARFALAQVPDPNEYVAIPARALRPGLDAGFAPLALEVLERVHVPDDGAAAAVALLVVPVDRLGNVADLAAPEAVTVRTGGLVRIVSPDTDLDPFSETLTVSDARGTALVLDDPGGALDDANADLLTVEGAGELMLLDAALPDPDVDDSGLVDATDLALVEAAVGLRLGEPGFDPTLDVNGDGRVNGKDEAAVQAAQGSAIAIP